MRKDWEKHFILSEDRMNWETIRVYYKTKITGEIWILEYGKKWFEWWGKIDRYLRNKWRTFLYSTIISWKKTQLVYQKLNDLRNSGKLKKRWND